MVGGGGGAGGGGGCTGVGGIWTGKNIGKLENIENIEILDTNICNIRYFYEKVKQHWKIRYKYVL